MNSKFISFAVGEKDMEVVLPIHSIESLISENGQYRLFLNNSTLKAYYPLTYSEWSRIRNILMGV